MKRAPRDSREGIFAGGMGVDCVVQGVVISALTLVSFYLGTVAEYGPQGFGQIVSMLAANPEMAHEGMTMAFLTLSMVEMFHSFNMRSRRQSIFTLRGQNWWLWGAFLVAFLLTFLVIEIPFLANMFKFTVLDLGHYGMALGLAILIIPIMELYKAIMRAVEKNKA